MRRPADPDRSDPLAHRAGPADCTDVETVWEAIKRLSRAGRTGHRHRRRLRCRVWSADVDRRRSWRWPHGASEAATIWPPAAPRPSTCFGRWTACDKAAKCDQRRTPPVPRHCWPKRKPFTKKIEPSATRSGVWRRPAGRRRGRPHALQRRAAGHFRIRHGAVRVLYGQDNGKQLHVFVDETRPLLQGARLTAWELAQRGIDATLICDSMAAR